MKKQNLSVIQKIFQSSALKSKQVNGLYVNTGFHQYIVRMFAAVMVSMICINYCSLFVNAGMEEVTAPSAVLMDPKTGAVLYEKNSHEKRSPASITKIMTLFLIFEALENETIHLEDEVMTSEHAMSMGGSQVYLETGEIQTVETLIKCIVVASGNDASVAMAEYIAGSESAFVERMNQKAAILHMEDTHFVDCCGLTSDPQHYTSAYDIAVLTRYFMVCYPEIFNYSGIWMEDIVHNTRRGTETFTISSTNKLLKSYSYATGLKTGYTQAAKYCLSATARKDGRDMIAVVMGASDSKIRNQEAVKLLEYGFNSTMLYTDMEAMEVKVPVKFGCEEFASAYPEKEFACTFDSNINIENITREIKSIDYITAPAMKGEKAGEIIYYLNQKEIGKVDIILQEDVPMADYPFCIRFILRNSLL